jgi:hypothetical protein
LTLSERETLQRITRGLPHLRALWAIVDEGDCVARLRSTLWAEDEWISSYWSASSAQGSGGRCWLLSRTSCGWLKRVATVARWQAGGLACAAPSERPPPPACLAVFAKPFRIEIVGAAQTQEGCGMRRAHRGALGHD